MTRTPSFYVMKTKTKFPGAPSLLVKQRMISLYGTGSDIDEKSLFGGARRKNNTFFTLNKIILMSDSKFKNFGQS